MARDEAREAQKEALRRAIEAVVKKDARTFLKHLYESKFMDGAKRRLSQLFETAHGRKLDDDKVHEILTIATDKFYGAVSKGGKILFPESYLWKVIKNVAIDVCSAEKRCIPLDETIDETISIDQRMIHTATAECGESEGDRGNRIKEGIKIARSLLPRIGTENVQKVMTYIIDAVEGGEEDVTNQEIAEALGLSGTSVRKWKQRGWERLERAAIEAGYKRECLSVINLGCEEEE